MPGVIDRYRDRLPFADGDPVVSLHEGSTPLLHAPLLSREVGAEVHLKLEGANPTGSFKDRGMTCAVSDAVRDGAEAVVCASTGNTAASLAAYAARAGLRGAVIVPEGKIAAGKLAQALMHGARVIALRGNFDRALELVRGAPVAHPETVASAIRIGNPARWEEAMAAMTESEGAIDMVSDAEILAAYRFLAAHEGVFCEPASAASVAGLLRHGAGEARRVVCVLTGHGLKDPQTALEQSGSVVPCAPELAAVEQAILG